LVSTSLPKIESPSAYDLRNYNPKVIWMRSPNYKANRPFTRGNVSHSTRGGTSSDELELKSTLNWFMNTASQASSHAVIAKNGDIYLMVPLEHEAWTTGYLNNQYTGVELVQARRGDIITVAQYKSYAWWLLVEFRKKYPGVPISRVTLPEHKDTSQGISVGKTDVDLPFTTEELLKYVEYNKDLPLLPGQRFA
jgi:N-acetyl-anhydromuramyl-L-alanine amidase AmpD